ncbi:MAG: HAD hydrolase-like protein [Amylibacter sp.]|nr:HAD hydrolase-like protein [Amylibacter sp.]
MLSTATAFQRYQEIRHRLPTPPQIKSMLDIENLTDISTGAGAFVFDAFGVLNVGDCLIEGVDKRLNQLRRQGCEIRILTNAASYDRTRALEKFDRLGIAIEDAEIITSRDATLAALTESHWGVITDNDDELNDIKYPHTRLGLNAAKYDAVDGFLFLSSSNWSKQKQELLEATLISHARPVLVANADLVAPRETGFSLEPGFYGHLLLDRGITDIRFFGKPFQEVYKLVRDSLPPLNANEIIMCGDTLHTDVLGATAQGWRSVLVTQDGMFSGHDTDSFCKQSGIYADWRVKRI